MSTKNLSKTFQIFMFSDKLHSSSLFLLTLAYMKLLVIKIQGKQCSQNKIYSTEEILPSSHDIVLSAVNY